MAYSNGIISGDVRQASDVAAVMGLPTTNVGLGYLCSNGHGKINMWSRMKPVHIANTPFPNRNGQWWKGTNQNCGIVAATATSYRTAIEKFTGDRVNGWRYSPPRGGESSPYRLADFRNYYHFAEPPVKEFYVTSEAAVDRYITGTLMQREPSTDKTGAGSVDFEDMTISGQSLDMYAFGFVVTDGEGNVKGRVFSRNLLLRFKLTKGLFTEGKTYYAYPMFAKHAMAQDTADITNVYVPVPNVGRAAFTVVSPEEASGWGIRISAWYIYDDNHNKIGIHWEVAVSNNGSNGHVNGVGVQARYGAFGEALNVDEPSRNIGEYTVPSGQTVTQMGDMYGINPDKPYRLDVTVNTGYYVYYRSIAIFAEAEELPAT